MKRFFAIIGALVLCLSVFSACSEEKVPAGDTNLDKVIVGKVDGVEITQADYNLIYRTIYDGMSQYEQYVGAEWILQPYDGVNKVYDYIKNNTTSQLSNMIVAEKLAEEMYSINAEDKDVKKAADKQYKELKKQVGDAEAYKEFLREAKTTDEAVKRSILRSEIFARFEKKISSEGEEAYVSEEEAFESFKAEKLRVQHILISTKEQSDPETGEPIPARSDEEAQKIVNEVLGKLEKGEDFDALIDKYDEDPGMESGKFYVFGEGEMVAEFEKASKELNVGEYTKEGVKTDYGYHIIKKYEISKDIEEFQTYLTTLTQQSITMVLNAKLAEYEVEWKSEDLGKYVLNWVNELRKTRGQEALTEEMIGINFPTEEEINATPAEDKKKAE